MVSISGLFSLLYSYILRSMFSGISYGKNYDFSPFVPHQVHIQTVKEPFINYVRFSRRRGVGKISTSSYFGLGRGGQTHSYVIFSKSIFYIRNCEVKWFGRDHVSFV